MMKYAAAFLLFTASASAQDTPAFPKARFLPWEYRQNANAINTLGYTEATWNKATNVIGSNEVEDMLWEQLTPSQQSAAQALGISEEQWTCWIHHYDDFAWDEMPAFARQGYTALGWDQATWDSPVDNPPATYRKFWTQLTPAEQAGAQQICLTPQMWSEDDLDTWYHYIPPSQLTYPEIRYAPWSALPDKIRDIADAIGYNENTWNTPGTLPLEKQDWYDLTQQQRLLYAQLGFDQPQYDCYVNHFEGYFYEDLAMPSLALTSTVRALGYTGEASWDYGTDPVTVLKYWSGLTSENQAALKALCYHEHMWDGESITSWPEQFLSTGVDVGNSGSGGMPGGAVFGIIGLVAFVAIAAFFVVRRVRSSGRSRPANNTTAPSLEQSDSDVV